MSQRINFENTVKEFLQEYKSWEFKSGYTKFRYHIPKQLYITEAISQNNQESKRQMYCFPFNVDNLSLFFALIRSKKLCELKPVDDRFETFEKFAYITVGGQTRAILLNHFYSEEKKAWFVEVKLNSESGTFLAKKFSNVSLASPGALSSYSRFAKKLNDSYEDVNGDDDFGEDGVYCLQESIILVCTKSQTSQLIKSITLNFRKLQNSFTFSVATQSGEITFFRNHTMIGNSIILVSDIQSAINVIIKNPKIIFNSIIIEDNTSNSVAKHQDALRNLLQVTYKRKEKPTCFVIASTNYKQSEQPWVNSFNFSTFTWGLSNINHTVFKPINPVLESSEARDFDFPLDKLNVSIDKIKDYQGFSVNLIDDNRFDELFDRLYRLNNIDTSSISLNNKDLLTLVQRCSYYLLRSLTLINDMTLLQFKETITNSLAQCRHSLYTDALDEPLKEITALLLNYIEQYYSSYAPKYSLLAKLIDELSKSDIKEIVIVVDKTCSEVSRKDFLLQIRQEVTVECKIQVLKINEYLFNRDSMKQHSILISGWFKTDEMSRLFLFPYSRHMRFILYPIELKWLRSFYQKMRSESFTTGLMSWQEILISDSNLPILPEVVTNLLRASSFSFNSIQDYEKIEEDFYRSRSTKRLQAIRDESGESENYIEAIPVGFSNNYFGYFTDNHKHLCVTDILKTLNDKNHQNLKNINLFKLQSQIELEDFIIFKSSNKDIIREEADRILEKERNHEARNMAIIWKEQLNGLLSRVDKSELIEIFKTRNFNLNIPTLNNWINPEGTIFPEDSRAITILSDVSRNKQLKLDIPKIEEAANIVRAAHQRAGFSISERLVKTITQISKSNEYFEFSNFTEGIELDQIGQVLLLEVENIETPVRIPLTKVNRLYKD